MQPEGVAAVMFSNGGSDAVESALKMARQFHKLRGHKDRSKFIAMRQGYHGVHFGGMSVNGNTHFRRAYEPLLPGCFHIDSPWLYRNAYTQDEAEARAHRRRLSSSARSSSRARTRWPPSSPSRSRAPAASSCRRRTSGRWCARSATATACC